MVNYQRWFDCVSDREKIMDQYKSDIQLLTVDHIRIMTIIITQKLWS